jgi:hypothetical protein
MAPPLDFPHGLPSRHPIGVPPHGLPSWRPIGVPPHGLPSRHPIGVPPHGLPVGAPLVCPHMVCPVGAPLSAPTWSAQLAPHCVPPHSMPSRHHIAVPLHMVRPVGAPLSIRSNSAVADPSGKPYGAHSPMGRLPEVLWKIEVGIYAYLKSNQSGPIRARRLPLNNFCYPRLPSDNFFIIQRWFHLRRQRPRLHFHKHGGRLSGQEVRKYSGISTWNPSLYGLEA